MPTNPLQNLLLENALEELSSLATLYGQQAATESKKILLRCIGSFNLAILNADQNKDTDFFKKQKENILKCYYTIKEHSKGRDIPDVVKKMMSENNLPTISEKEIVLNTISTLQGYVKSIVEEIKEEESRDKRRGWLGGEHGHRFRRQCESVVKFFKHLFNDSMHFNLLDGELHFGLATAESDTAINIHNSKYYKENLDQIIFIWDELIKNLTPILNSDNKKGMFFSVGANFRNPEELKDFCDSMKKTIEQINPIGHKTTSTSKHSPSP